jgi:type II secretory pathway predicted ATPase ExeA
MMHKLISYWGFSRIPFGRDLAPSMLHRHTAHGEAVARIGWCIAERRIGVITGEVGSGKTVAVRAATAALDGSRHAIIYLPNPSVGMRGMLHHVVSALGHTPKFYTATLAPQAADALATEHAERGRTPVVVIDEAHLLDNQQLEAIRMLTNHDMDSQSPFACLLVGQPTLRRRIKLGVLAALDQRIALRYAMPPMADTETHSYLRHHLALAGRKDTLFSDDAIALIHQTSRGYPARSTTSPYKPSSPHSPPTKPSSTNPQPAQRSPKSRQTEHHTDTPNTTDPAGHQPAGSFHTPTSSPSMPPSCSS